MSLKILQRLPAAAYRRHAVFLEHTLGQAAEHQVVFDIQHPALRIAGTGFRAAGKYAAYTPGEHAVLLKDAPRILGDIPGIAGLGRLLKPESLLVQRVRPYGAGAALQRMNLYAVVLQIICGEIFRNEAVPVLLKISADYIKIKLLAVAAILQRRRDVQKLPELLHYAFFRSRSEPGRRLAVSHADILGGKVLHNSIPELPA